MTDELKNALLKSNIQCINEYDGKFVLLNTTVQNNYCFVQRKYG